MPRISEFSGAALLCLVTLATTPAYASCGSSFCTLNTNEDATGLWLKPGWRLDLRAEYVKQDTLRAGRNRTAPAGEPDTHDELRTINRNLLATLDYSWNPQWGITLQAPWLDRFHQHIDNDPGGPELEQWRFHRLGDVRVIGRYQFAGIPEHDYAAGVQFGLKLPTGSTEARNSDGTLAERSLQPGSGTTDLILGAYYSAPLSKNSGSWFIQGMATSALNRHDNYRPGTTLTLNTGLNYALTDQVGALLQLNLSHRERDRGAQAEPEKTGSTQVFVSPGISLALTRSARLYGFVQLPVYQKVNGVQTTADRTIIIGWGQVF